MPETSAERPLHIEETVSAIAALHAEHHRQATPVQRTVERLTAFAGRPRFIGWLTLVLLVWIGLNAALSLGGDAFDPPPFVYLELLGTFLSVYIAVLVLITQRRQSRLAERRDQLTLELALLNEQKSAKIIALLEELRRDHPDIADRQDPHADALAVPADPQAVLQAIQETHDPVEATAGVPET